MKRSLCFALLAILALGLIPCPATAAKSKRVLAVISDFEVTVRINSDNWCSIPLSSTVHHRHVAYSVTTPEDRGGILIMADGATRLMPGTGWSGTKNYASGILVKMAVAGEHNTLTIRYLLSEAGRWHFKRAK